MSYLIIESKLKYVSFILVKLFFELQSPVEITLRRTEQPWNAFCIQSIVFSINNLSISHKQHSDVFLYIRLHNTQNSNHIFIQIELLPSLVCELVSVLSLRNSQIHGVQNYIYDLHIRDHIRKFLAISNKPNKVLANSDLIAIECISFIYPAMVSLTNKLIILEICSLEVILRCTKNQCDLLPFFLAGENFSKLPVVESGSVNAKKFSQGFIVFLFFAFLEQRIKLSRKNNLLIRFKLLTFKFGLGVQFYPPHYIRLYSSESHIRKHNSTKIRFFLEL